jgi:hypothetical protein
VSARVGRIARGCPSTLDHILDRLDEIDRGEPDMTWEPFDAFPLGTNPINGANDPGRVYEELRRRRRGVRVDRAHLNLLEVSITRIHSEPMPEGGVAFEICGLRSTLEEMLEANAEDSEVCDWLRAAAVGDVLDTFQGEPVERVR